MLPEIDMIMKKRLRLLICKNKIFNDMKMTHFIAKFPCDPL